MLNPIFSHVCSVSSPLATFSFQYNSWDGADCILPHSSLRTMLAELTFLHTVRESCLSQLWAVHAFTPLHRQVRKMLRKLQPTSLNPLQSWENSLWFHTAGSRDFYMLQKTTRETGALGSPLGFQPKTIKKTDWISCLNILSFFLSFSLLPTSEALNHRIIQVGKDL